MKTIWIVAVVLAAMALVGVGRLPSQVSRELAGKQVAFIGSSLIRAAVPSTPIPGGALGDGAAHGVLGVTGLVELDETDLIRQAIRYPVTTVFAEIYAYIAGFAVKPKEVREVERGVSWTEGLIDPWSDAWDGATERLRDKVKLALGKPSWIRVFLLPDSRVDRVYDGNHVGLAGRYGYPMNTHLPKAPRALESVLAEARRRNVRVIFVAPPRSQEIADFLGAAAMSRLAEMEAEFAKRFGVEVWIPAAAWPNEYFFEAAHLNSRGRARFMEELRRRFGPPA